MKDEQRPVHQLEHAEPTVIHDPTQDMTILARWLQRGMEQGSRFWLMVGGAVVALIAISVLSSGLSAGRSAGAQAWTELTQAKTVEDRLNIAKAHPDTPVARWAKLLSAQEEYANGIDDLTTPGKRPTAGARLDKALQLFREVAQEAPKDSSQALGGMFGAARTLEARNELPEAIEQYRLVASKFPETPEAKQALALARALEEPVNVMFYKELYAYKPPATPATSGPGSIDALIPPGLTPGSLTAPGSGFKPLLPDRKVPDGLDAPPPSPSPVPPPSTPPPVVDPPKTEVPKTEAPKAEVPKTEVPAPPATPAVPADVPKVATPPK